MFRQTIAAFLLVSSSLAPSANGQVPANSPMGILDASDRATAAPTAYFKYGPDDLRTGELRVPRGRGPFPVAVLIHGGCFVKEMGGTGMQSLAEALRQRGFATWDIDYRRYGHAGGGFPGTFDDISAGVDYLPRLAKRYNLDMNRVTVMGHSAGAFFASWSAGRRKLEGPWRAKAGSPRFRSLFVIDGPGTLAPFVGVDRQVCGRPVIAPFMGGTPAQVPEAYRMADIAATADLGIPQHFVLADLGPLMQPYVTQVRKRGIAGKEIAPPNANHFDVITPSTANGKSVIDFIAANAFAGR